MYSTINAAILAKMAGVEHVLMSSDSIVKEKGADGDIEYDYPTEYLNTINASGLPVARLVLKVGCPIMVLRNITPSLGVCNGARGIVQRITNRILEIRLLGGDHAGEIVFLPRMALEPKNTDVPFQLRRCQFPVRLAFAMTINKAQGQSVKFVGLDLTIPVFTHGQFYVAMSRATSVSRIKVLLPAEDVATRKTQNVVYKEVLIPVSHHIPCLIQRYSLNYLQT